MHFGERDPQRGIFTPEQRATFARQDRAATEALTEIRTETIYVPRADARPFVTRQRELLEGQLRAATSPVARRFLRQQVRACARAERALLDRVNREIKARMLRMIDDWERRMILGGGKVGSE